MENVKIVKIKFSELTRLMVALLITRGTAIIQALQDNATVFIAPPFVPSVMETALQNLVAINGFADGDAGSRNDRNERDLQASNFLNMLLLTGVYVANVANGKSTYEAKKAIVELACYTVANENREPIEPEVVTGLKADVPVVIGERDVKIRWKRGKCQMFIVEGLKNGDPSSPTAEFKQLVLSTKARCELTLEPGIWNLRVVGIYAAGQSAPSANVAFIIS